MKNIVLFVMFILLVGVALANPLEPLFTSRFWFDNAGDLNVRYTDQWSQAWQADLFDGVNHYQRQINPENPATLTQVYPDAAGTSQSGYLQVTNLAYPGFSEEVHWGPGEDDQITSLAPGQCGIQFYFADGIENTIKIWGKDLISNPVNIFNPTQTSTLRVYCQNYGGTPLAGIPVYIISPYVPWQQTDATGWAIHSVVSTRTTVYIKDPQTNNIVYQTEYFAEPGQTYDITVTMSGSDNGDATAVPPAGTFTVLPNVLRSASESMVKVRYAGMLESGSLELYDLKGRLRDSTDFRGGEYTWQLPQLASGVYFIKLRHGTRELGVSKLIVLK